MKKTGYLVLLAFWLVMQALEARAYTYGAAAADSVIIQYRNSGRVAVAIPADADREALKNMSLNELFRALNLDEKDLSELDGVNFTPSESGESPIFGVKETPGVTEVRVGGIVVTVDETKGNTNVNVIRRRHREPAFRTYFNVDFGINAFLAEEGGFVSSQEPISTRGWGSWNLGLNWWASQRLVRGLNLNASLGAQLMRFNFDSRNTQVIRGADGVEVIQRTDVNALRSRLFASYLTAQTLMELDFGRMLYGQSGLAVAVGPYAGYRLGGSSTFVSRPFEGGSRNRDRIRDGLSLNNFRYGIRGEVDIKYFRIYVMYDLNPLFESGVDPVITPISFGIVL